MPKYVWELLRETALQTTRVTLTGANGQDLEAMGELLVMDKTKVQFKAVVARDGRRCLLSGTQLIAKGYTFTLSQQEKFSRSTKWRHKSDHIT